MVLAQATKSENVQSFSTDIKMEVHTRLTQVLPEFYFILRESSDYSRRFAHSMSWVLSVHRISSNTPRPRIERALK